LLLAALAACRNLGRPAASLAQALVSRRSAEVLKHFLASLGQVWVRLRLAQDVQQIGDITGAELHIIGAIDDRQVGLGQAGASGTVLVVAAGAESYDLLELIRHTIPWCAPCLARQRA
jgi:hypothetical protein